MATERQVQANSQNAKKSTGPRTAQGKAKVGLNALTHGLLAKAAVLPDEDEAAFQVFAHELLTDLRPIGAVESLLAEEIVNLAWRLQRASRVEAGIFVREQALADQAWYREEQRYFEITEGAAQLEAIKRLMDRRLPEDVIAISNPEHWADLGIQVANAGVTARSDLGRLGGAFTSDAASANALSKLSRYETAIARRIDRALNALKVIQAERELEPGDPSIQDKIEA